MLLLTSAQCLSLSITSRPLTDLPNPPSTNITIPVKVTALWPQNTSSPLISFNFSFVLPGFEDCLQPRLCAFFFEGGVPVSSYVVPGKAALDGEQNATRIDVDVTIRAPSVSSLNLLRVTAYGDGVPSVSATTPVAFGGAISVIDDDIMGRNCTARAVLLPYPPPFNTSLDVRVISSKGEVATRPERDPAVSFLHGGSSRATAPFVLGWKNGRGQAWISLSGTAALFYRHNDTKPSVVKARCSEYDYGTTATQALMVGWVMAVVVPVYTLFAVFGAAPVADVAAAEHRPRLLADLVFFTFQIFAVGSFASGFNFDMLYLTPSLRAIVAVPYMAALGVLVLSLWLRRSRAKRGRPVNSRGDVVRRLAWMMLVPAVHVFLTHYRVDKGGEASVVTGIAMAALVVAAPVFEVWRSHDPRPKRFVQGLLCWHFARAAAVPAILYIDYDSSFSLGHGLALLFVLGGAGAVALLFQPFGPNLLTEPYLALGALTAASAVGYLPAWRYQARRNGRYGGDVPSPAQAIVSTAATGLLSVVVAARVCYLLAVRLRRDARARMQSIISDARDAEFAEFSFLMPRAVVRSVMTEGGADGFCEGTIDASPSSPAFLRADDPCYPLLRVIDGELSRRGYREEGKFPWKPVMSRVTLGFNPTLFKAFVQRFKILANRGAELRAAWEDEPGAAERLQAEQVLSKLTARIVAYIGELTEKEKPRSASAGQQRNSADPGSGDAGKRAHPMFTADQVRASGLDLVWHGAPIPAITSIMKTGFVNLKKLNSGWFGSGAYTTHFSGYATYYFTRGFTTSENMTPQGEHALLLSWALTGKAYPVTNRIDRIDDPGHAHHGGYPGADCHYALVKFGGEVCTDYSSSPPDHLYDEIAIWQESQLLPFAIVYFYLK